MSMFLRKALGLLRVWARIGGSAAPLDEGFTPRLGLAVFLLLFNTLACAQEQNEWDEAEIAKVFDGIDLTAAKARLDERGVDYYDFGFILLRSGRPDKAKAWYNAIGGKTKDPQFIYGLAWMEWVTGNSRAAMDDARYILARKPPALIGARTYYLLGAVNVDDFNFEAARHNLNAGNEAYKALGKIGGQYLCTSMLAMCAVYEGRLDEVESLLEKAEDLRQPVKKAYSAGRHHEIIAEMRYAKGDFEGSLISARQSAAVYREGEEYHLADEVDAKIGLLLLLTGEPKAAKKLATALWEKHHKERDRGRVLAYNAIVLMKLSLCSENFGDAAEKERDARAWANSGPGGKSLTKVLDWAKEEKNFPCPDWR